MDLNPFRNIIAPPESSPFSEILRHKLGRKLRDTYEIFEGERDGPKLARLGLVDYCLLGLPALLNVLLNYLDRKKYPKIFGVIPFVVWLFINCIRWLLALTLTFACALIVALVHVFSSLVAKRDFELASKLEVISLMPYEMDRHYAAEAATNEELEQYIHDQEQVANNVDIIKKLRAKTLTLWVQKKNIPSRAEIMQTVENKETIAKTLRHPLLDESVSHHYTVGLSEPMADGDALYIFDDNKDYLPLRGLFAVSRKAVESEKARPDQKTAWASIKRLNLFEAGRAGYAKFFTEKTPPREFRMLDGNPPLPRVAAEEPSFFQYDNSESRPPWLISVSNFFA